MLRDPRSERFPPEVEVGLIRELVDGVSAAPGVLRDLEQFASHHSGDSDPATLGRGLLGSALFLHAAGAHAAAVDHVVAAARLSGSQRLRGLGLCLGLGGAFVVAHELADLDSRVARLRSATENVLVHALDSAAPPSLDWMVGAPGLVHALSLVGQPELAAGLRASLWLSLERHLDAFEETLPDEFSPLAHAHGLAGAIAALATRCPPSDEARLASAAWRLLDIVQRMPEPPLAWIPASWCGGHVGIASALRRASSMTRDEDLLSHSWTLFQAALELGEHQNEPLSVCHGLAGTVGVAASFVRTLETPDAAQVHAILHSRLLDECSASRDDGPANRELTTGMTGTLSAAGSDARFSRVLEVCFAI